MNNSMLTGFNFTSHYVPIKSVCGTTTTEGSAFFTSHYVPIKSQRISDFANMCSTLHPIMFLLNRVVGSGNVTEYTYFTSHYVPIKSHTNIILYFLPFSTPFLSTPAKTSQADVHNLLNYLLTTLLTPHESMDCQLSHKNALS